MANIQPTQPYTAFPAGSTPTLNQSSPIQDWGSTAAAHTMAVFATGTVTTGTFQLQGSQDSVNWYSIGGAQTPASNGVAFINIGAFPTRYTRVLCTAALTGGATVLVQSVSA